MNIRFCFVIIGILMIIYEVLKFYLPLEIKLEEDKPPGFGRGKKEKEQVIYQDEESSEESSPLIPAMFVPRFQVEDAWKGRLRNWKLRNGSPIPGFIVKERLAPVKYKIKTKEKIEILIEYDKEMENNPNSKVNILKGITIHRFPGGDDLNGIESVCKMALEYYLGVPFNKIDHPEIVNPLTRRKLELDLYNPNIVMNINGKRYCGLALEYQGPTHYYYPHRFPRTRAEFKMDAQRDAYKKMRCEELGIRLIEVPCVIPNAKVPLFIFNTLERDGYKFDPPPLAQKTKE